MADKYVLCVDPGVRTGGWCAWGYSMWLTNARHKKLVFGPVAAEVINVPRSSDRTFVSFLEESVNRVLGGFENVNDVWCEQPKVFTGTVLGVAAADDVMRIQMIVGYLWSTTEAHGGKFHAVPVNDWKGTMPKPVTLIRTLAVFNKGGVSTALLDGKASHVWDACGVGLHSMGITI